jgi:hypothetical protein
MTAITTLRIALPALLLSLLTAQTGHAEDISAPPSTNLSPNRYIIPKEFVVANKLIIECEKGEAVLEFSSGKVTYTDGCTPTDAGRKLFEYTIKAYREDCK